MLTLPNLLTLSRIFAVPVLVALLWGAGWFGYLVAFIVYCIVGLTDYLDGYLARSQGTVSKLGMFLDPIADKIMVASAILMLVFTRDIDGWNVIAALIILLREIIVSGLREFLAGLSVSVPVSQLAKWKTGIQMFSLGALILAGSVIHAGWTEFFWVKTVALTSLWIAAGLTMITGWDYLRAGLKHMD